MLMQRTKFYINDQPVLSDDPRLVVFLTFEPRPTREDVIALRFEMRRRKKGVIPLVSVVYKHSGKMIFSKN
jgi:hypothetical protein